MNASASSVVFALGRSRYHITSSLHRRAKTDPASSIVTSFRKSLSVSSSGKGVKFRWSIILFQGINKGVFFQDREIDFWVTVKPLQAVGNTPVYTGKERPASFG
jgi:hypothetical protein